MGVRKEKNNRNYTPTTHEIDSYYLESTRKVTGRNYTLYRYLRRIR
jgi:hypothetical protein